MGLLSRFFGTKYDDEQLVARATSAIEEDTTIKNPGRLSVSSDKGIVRLSGQVSAALEKAHVEGTVRSALKITGLKFADVVNEIVVGR